MSDHYLTVNEFAQAAPESLFHEPAFFRLHAGEGGRYFQWKDDRKVV